MPTSKSKPDLHYPCRGAAKGCLETLTYVRKQHGGAKPVWCKECFAERNRARKRKGSPGYRG